MAKLFFISLLFSFLVAQTDNELQKKQQQSVNKLQQEFTSYKKSQEDEFSNYKEAQLKIFNNYKKELSILWNKPKLSTKKSWISYTSDKKTRADVDFSKNTIVIETIASSPKKAKQQLQKALSKVVTIDTKIAQQTDQLEQKISKLKKPIEIIDAPIKAEPILSTIIFNKPPTKKSLFTYVNKKIIDKKIKAKKSEKVENEKVYTITVKLPNDTMQKRSKIYYKEIKRRSKKENIPIALVFAIMHSESNFNPRARSYIPAYGLMQIVPKSAGLDAYNYLYKKKKLVTSRYLYDSKNNITMGSAYLHILYYRYLKKIKNLDSRLYCTIAAYNTGAGNIAWAFTRTNNMSKAAPIINQLTSDEVYKKLLKNLKYNEPKKYLKKVTKRMSAYKKLYGT